MYTEYEKVKKNHKSNKPFWSERWGIGRQAMTRATITNRYMQVKFTRESDYLMLNYNKIECRHNIIYNFNQMKCCGGVDIY